VTDQPLEPDARSAPAEPERDEGQAEPAQPEQVQPEQVKPDETPPDETPAEEARTQVIPPSAAPEPTERLLRRSRDDRVIAGVCGGLGRYLGVDPVLIRIAALILVLAGGAGVVLYGIGWIAIPEDAEGGEGTGYQPASGAETPDRTTGAVVLGLVFVVLGMVFLTDEVWPDFLSWQYVWPVALIGVGLAIIFRGRR
jgi:phage shock protein C